MERLLGGHYPPAAAALSIAGCGHGVWCIKGIKGRDSWYPFRTPYTACSRVLAGGCVREGRNATSARAL